MAFGSNQHDPAAPGVSLQAVAGDLIQKNLPGVFVKVGNCPEQQTFATSGGAMQADAFTFCDDEVDRPDMAGSQLLKSKRCQTGTS